MQIVIDISEELYKASQMFDARYEYTAQIPFTVIRNGIPLPKGHGRLIDVDAIPEQIELKGFLSQDNAHLVTIYRVKEALNNAPTIIEADRSEK